MTTEPDELVLLLPPSEGKAAGGLRGPQATRFARRLAPERRRVRAAIGATLGARSPSELAKVVGVRGELLDRALAAMSSLATGRPPVLPAWQRYTGVVWEHLAPEDLTDAELSRILVPSGVYGVTTADDLIADYRLKMTARIDGIGQLGAFWRSSVTRAIARFGSGIIVDLLPGEHRAAIDVEELGRHRDVISVHFKAADGVGAAGHAAKAVKGRIAFVLLRQGLAGLDGLALDGWLVRPCADGYEVVALA